MLKTAIIGAGNMGRQHTSTLQSLTAEGLPVLVSVIADVTPDALASVATTSGVSGTSADWYSTVARGDIDVVHICTPNTTHFEIAKAALLHGKHVVCEKPLALSAIQSAELVALAEASGLTGTVCHTYRAYEASELARRLVLTGALGDVHMVRGGYVQGWLASPLSWDWRVDPLLGGPSRAMADIGSHWLDLAAFVTGESPNRLIADLHVVVPRRRRPDTDRTVTGLDEPRPFSDVNVTTEDYGSVMFRTDTCPGIFTVSQVSEGHDNTFWLEVDGSEASLTWHSEEPRRVQLRGRNNVTMIEPSASRSAGPLSVHANAMRRMFVSAYSDIMGTPVSSANRVHATFRDGHRSAQLLDAILESAALQQWTSVGSSSPSTHDGFAIASLEASS